FAAVFLIVGAGVALGTLHDRRDFLGSLAPLVLWGGAQQWVLQTLVLREAQRGSSRAKGIVIAAVLFGVVHLPNPLLTSVTGAAALVWCWLYDRHPNIVPLALSHGLGTLALRYAFDEAIIGRLRIGAAYLRQGRQTISAPEPRRPGDQCGSRRILSSFANRRLSYRPVASVRRKKST